MADLTIIFRTQSDVEASIVRGLLESHGVPTVVTSALTQAIFPMAINGLGEVRISVHPEDAEEAQRIIESHRTELPNGRVVRLRDEFEALQQAAAYRFRDRGLREHAMTHTSRANEDVSGGVTDNESLEFLGDAVLGFVIADVLFREFPDYDEGQMAKIRSHVVSREVEDEGGARLDGDAGAPGRAAEPRRSPAARPGRGKNRRPPQAGAARRRIRGAHRRDLSRRRDGAGLRVPRARVRAAHLRRENARARGAGPQVGAAGVSAVARGAAARVPRGRRGRARSQQAVSGRGRRPGRADRERDRSQ